MAEREGFEPPLRLRVKLISSQPHSTTLPPLRAELLIQLSRHKPTNEADRSEMADFILKSAQSSHAPGLVAPFADCANPRYACA